MQAARNGTAEASMQRPAALAHSPEHTRGFPMCEARRELAQYTLCRLHPAHHRDWLRAAISPRAGATSAQTRRLLSGGAVGCGDESAR